MTTHCLHAAHSASVSGMSWPTFRLSSCILFSCFSSSTLLQLLLLQDLHRAIVHRVRHGVRERRSGEERHRGSHITDRGCPSLRLVLQRETRPRPRRRSLRAGVEGRRQLHSHCQLFVSVECSELAIPAPLRGANASNTAHDVSR